VLQNVKELLRRVDTEFSVEGLVRPPILRMKRGGSFRKIRGCGRDRESFPLYGEEFSEAYVSPKVKLLGAVYVHSQ